jgi:YD repeat-containing protein
LVALTFSTTYGQDAFQSPPLTGSAAYSIPIALPPGTNGVQPNLTIAYNSDSGNGWVGEGWTVTGLGYIERLGPNWSPAPTYGSSDTYRLNMGGTSQKLVYAGVDPTGASGNYYRTQIESFLRIEYVSTSNYWIVTNTGGTKFYFGQTAASRQGSQVFRWYLNKVLDPRGTFWTVSYDQDTTNFDMYPKQIVYTQGPGLACTPTNLTTCRQVDFFTEQRSDLITSYHSGANVVEDKRLKTIDVRLGGQLLRRYTLSYTMSPATARRFRSVSQLASVTETGADGSTSLPPTIFTYHVDTNSSTLDFTDTAFAVGVDNGMQQYLQATDINGDGLADLLVTSPGYYFRLNDNGAELSGTLYPYSSDPNNNLPLLYSGDTNFRPQYYSTQLPGTFDYSTVQAAVFGNAAVVDLNGDHLPDILDTNYTGPNGVLWRWWSNQGTEQFTYEGVLVNSPTTALGYYTSIDPDGAPTSGFRFADMNGDDLVDIVWLEKVSQTAVASTWNLTWRQNLGNGQFSSTLHSITGFTIYATYPKNSNYGETLYIRPSMLWLVDMNGDGLPDLAWRAFDQYSYIDTENPMHIYYYPNNGGANFGALVSMALSTGGGLSLAYNPVFIQPVDFNGDGLPDIFQGPDVTYGAANGYFYYPNQGNNTFGPRVTLSHGSTINPSSTVNKFELTDMNGDGIADIIKGTFYGGLCSDGVNNNCWSNWDYYSLDMSSTHRKLETITTPQGGRLTLAYRYEPKGNVRKWVLSQITGDNGLGQAATTDYAYSGGVFVGWPQNEFRGYRTVTVTDPPDQNNQRHTTTTTFYQDDAKKGRPDTVAVKNSAGALFTYTSYSYATSTPVGGVSRVDLTSQIVNTEDGNIGSKSSRTDYADFDSYGNTGQVTTSGTNTTSRITTTDFASNTSAYIVNRPSHTFTTVNGITINERWLNYDGKANGVAPTMGDLTQETRWLSGGANNPTTQYFYDAYGNRIGTIDPNGYLDTTKRCSSTGYTAKTTFDTTFQTFPLTETDALCHAKTRTYWGVNTTLSAASVSGAYAVPGRLATVTDPNNIRTDSYWDALGRAKANVIPPDTAAAPTTVWSYGITGTAPSYTAESKRESVGAGTLDKATHVDGFARTVQTKSEAETAGQWITTDTVYNSRGLVESVSVPYPTATSSYTPPVATQPKTTTYYDAVRRPVEIQNPDHTTTSPSKHTIAYQVWVTTETNERGYSTSRSYDAYGRLVSVQEPTPDGGTTLYSYDTFDTAGNNIQTITDAQGNLTTITIDTLGRKATSYDPDLGPRIYSYDANGNLLTQTDGKGQTLIFTYDGLNRVVTKAASATPDTTPPVISAVASVNITPSGATMIWTTDELSDSQVEYGATTAYGSSSALNSSLVTSHSVTLSGLTAGTLYHYRVKSRDAANNMATSGDFTFTTTSDTSAPTGTVIINNGAAYTNTTAVTLTLTCNDTGSGCAYMQIAIDGTADNEPFNTPFATTYSVTLLTGDGTKTVAVKFKDGAGNVSAQVTDTIILDLTLPSITSVAASGITVTGATLNWTTNELSDSQVEYGTTTAYGNSSTLNTSLVTSHSVTLSGLAASTTYHYRVKSKDAAGNLAVSSDFTFATQPALLGVTAVSTGLDYACAVLSSGAVKCWGYNFGTLGDGTINDSPVPVIASGISTATAVAAGYFHTCARLSNSTLKCWGYNGSGELGNGTINNSNTPVAVSGISTATAVTAGFFHTCALLTNGTVKCWGDNSSGQLGTGSPNNQLQPGTAVSGIATATAVVAGRDHTCALLSNGTVSCWGDNSSGQLGNGTLNNAPTPVAVNGITTATAIEAGDAYTCARLSDSTLKCWGFNGGGQLGTGNTNNLLQPGAAISGITTAAGVKAGSLHTCARLSDSTVKCWGTNSQGQLGTGNTSSLFTPGAAVSGITTAVSISAGGASSCAVLSDTTVRCWGSDDHGQLGNGPDTALYSTIPVTVASGQ